MECRSAKRVQSCRVCQLKAAFSNPWKTRLIYCGEFRAAGGWKNDIQRTKQMVHRAPLYAEQSRETKKPPFGGFGVPVMFF